MKDLLDIRHFVEQKIQSSQAAEQLVLCTLIRKTGSSYRSVGAKKIVSLSGSSVGLLSGGCLEASIEKFARENYDRLPQTQLYDMLSDEDRLLGYQTGCQGAIEILFERVELDSKDFLTQRIPYDPIQLYIVGCGADAPAYGPLAQSMGWEIHYLDYRRNLVENFMGAQAVYATPKQMGSLIPHGPRVAVMLMTHNFEADLEILNHLRHHRVGYLGCLGPAERFARLQKDLLQMYDRRLDAELLTVAHGPAGIFSRGRSPEEIAFSVVAEIHQILVDQSGAEAQEKMKREQVTQKPWAVILAAGESRRYGGGSKALAEFSGSTFLERALAIAKVVAGGRVMVVTGAHNETLSSHLSSVQSVYNPQWSQGMGSSISCGLTRVLTVDPHASGVILMTVDQPYVTVEHLKELCHAGQNSDRCALTALDDVMGPPAYVPSLYFPLAQALKGERGLKSVLKLSQIIGVESSSALRDFDTREEMQCSLQ